METQSVAAELRNVPNQPLVFHQDGHERKEDDLIAYTWDQFLRTGDERWPARLPMTKAAVRAMDAITAFCASRDGGRIPIEHFVVAGASKRGWTTWTTAAVDKRVIGIAPIVIDVLNLEPSMKHHYAAYGFWAPAVGDYVRRQIMDWIGTPQNRALARIEDPYEYRQRFTMPKLILNATGDQFFLPDSSQFYFDDLAGEKYLRYVPNTDHSMKGSDAWETLQAFYQSLLLQRPMPRFSWTLEPDGAIKVKATDMPKAITLWQATNPQARDFRLETFGPKWTSSPLTLDHGQCVARLPEPPQGWTAFMVELTYDGPGNRPLKLTTSVRVVPDKLDHVFKPNPPATKRQ
jgi:PhoPQ-activated pathogenicity-related protein